MGVWRDRRALWLHGGVDRARRHQCPDRGRVPGQPVVNDPNLEVGLGSSRSPDSGETMTASSTRTERDEPVSIVDSSTVPVYSEDLYSESAILDPYPHYRRLRDLGPVVWLDQHRVFALPRYAEVRMVLADDDTFRTGDGVSLNPRYNKLLHGSTFASDGPHHAFLRGIVGEKLTPKALRPQRQHIERTADVIVDEVVSQQSFDSVTDLARQLVLAIVPDLLGIPADGRDRLIDWAAANFNCHGPWNERARHSLPVAGQMAEYATRLVDERRPHSEGIARCVLDALDDGRIEREQAISMMIDYLVPSLDTTVTGLATAIWLFAQHPDQWDRLRAEPSLTAMAFNEVIRLETPVRQFGRRVAQDTVIADVAIPKGSQVLVMFASANRDERKWDRPESFDITRNPVDHVGFGYGSHGCAGQGLARLEAQAALKALSRRVDRFQVDGERRTVNNLMRAFDQVPTRVVLV